jgi:transcription-repair coupling factor (superfamily II helicase)
MRGSDRRADAPITDFGRVGKRGVHLAVWALEHGFEAPGLTVISEQDVLGDRLIRAPRKKRRAENFLTEAQSLAPAIWWCMSITASGAIRGWR